MKRFLLAALLAATAIGFSTEVLAQVSVSVGQPGFYGHIDIGGYPQPQVIYRQPKAAWRVPVNQAPVYMRVPRGHARNWKRHCNQYNACNQRVLFVRDKWYNQQYAPRYQEQYGGDRGEHRGDDNNRGEHRGNDNDYNRGNDNNRGHGRNH